MSVKRSEFTPDDKKFATNFLEREAKRLQGRVDVFNAALAERATATRTEKEAAMKEGRSPGYQEPNLRDLYSEIVWTDLGSSDVEPVGKNQTFRPPYDFGFIGRRSITRSDEPLMPSGGAFLDRESGRMGGWAIASVEGADDSDFATVVIEPHLVFAVDVERTGNLQVRLSASPNAAAMGGITSDEWGFSDVQVFQVFRVFARVLPFDGRETSLRLVTDLGGEHFSRREDSHWSRVSRTTVDSGFVTLDFVDAGDRVLIDLQGELVNTFSCNDVTVSASMVEDWRVFEVGLRVV